MQLSFPGLERPNTSLMVSALVKSIRLRRTEDAIKWLVALWFYPTLRSRVTRRVLISSAEDGISPAVVGSVAEWFNSPSRYVLRACAEKAVQVCKSPAWWVCEEGHAYIDAWFRAEREASALQTHSSHSCWRVFENSVRAADTASGLSALTRLFSFPDFSNYLLVEPIGRIVEENSSAHVLLLFDAWRLVAPALGRDTNLIGLLAYLMLGGVLRADQPVTLSRHEVVQLIANAQRSAADATKPPDWANDGIHACGPGRRDDRFAGTVGRFAAMCRAFDYYGRLDPADPWLPGFWK